MSTDRTVRWINTFTALMAVTAVSSIQALSNHSTALRPSGWWMVLVIAVAFGLANQLGIERSEASDYIKRYFARFPGIWCHGDFAEITPHDGMIIHGRSDATLNPGGVRCIRR